MSDRSISLAIWALGLGAFAVGTSEFAAMGLLPYYAADLGLNEAQAGHVVSAYALGVVVGAPLTTILGARLPRRRYLAALIAFYGLANLMAALMPGYLPLVAARFLAGLPHGGYLGVAQLVAAAAMPHERRAEGAARILMGLAAANVIGVPLAGAMGPGIGWRWGFALPGAIATVAAILVLRLAPRVGAEPDARPLRELHALGNVQVLSVLFVGAIGFGGMFAVYSYLSAAILATTQAPGWAIPLTLSLFGGGLLAGNWLAGRWTTRWGQFRAAGICLVLMLVTQGVAAGVVGVWPLMVGSALLLGLGGGLAIPLQTRLMDVAGRAQSMAAALNHAAFNAANALGPWLAGMALMAGWGWRAPGYVAMGLSFAGLVALSLAIRVARRR